MASGQPLTHKAGCGAAMLRSLLELGFWKRWSAGSIHKPRREEIGSDDPPGYHPQSSPPSPEGSTPRSMDSKVRVSAKDKDKLRRWPMWMIHTSFPESVIQLSSTCYLQFYDLQLRMSNVIQVVRSRHWIASMTVERRSLLSTCTT